MAQPEIRFKVIPHNEQRYDTCGDYYFENGVWEFRVSDLGDPTMEQAIFLHEFAEWSLAMAKGIKEEDITTFDEAFEELRMNFPMLIGDQEPGDMVSAPYHNEHVFATDLERQFIKAHHYNWDRYDEAINNL